jgi:hypothetical protein
MSDYIRRVNMGSARFAPPLVVRSDGNRGLINEVGFRLYSAALGEGVRPSKLDSASVSAAAADALRFIRRFRAEPREQLVPPTGRDLAEAAKIAERIALFVHTVARGQDVLPWPSFRGCGAVDECDGDLLIGETLCEVKAGDVAFRGRDIRQVLVYGALNWIARTYPIAGFYVVNPRRGTYLRDTFDGLCVQIAGCASLQVFDEITQYLLEPHWRDETV